MVHQRGSRDTGGLAAIADPARPLDVVLVLTLLSRGRIDHCMHRPDSVVVAPEYLAFIEPDDRGKLWSPAQVSHRIRTASATEEGAIPLRGFIHGC